MNNIWFFLHLLYMAMQSCYMALTFDLGMVVLTFEKTQEVFRTGASIVMWRCMKWFFTFDLGIKHRKNSVWQKKPFQQVFTSAAHIWHMLFLLGIHCRGFNRYPCVCHYLKCAFISRLLNAITCLTIMKGIVLKCSHFCSCLFMLS